MLQRFEFRPALDTLRFLAFLSVFISHAILFLPPVCSEGCQAFLRTHLTIGDLGVSTFFVLSGFLISILLFTELNRTNNIKLSGFYTRRILRIWPLYALIVFIGVILVPQFISADIFGSTWDLSKTGDLWRLLTFTFNFDHQYHFVHVSLVLGVLWSISVEEQFYAVWPLVLKVIKRKLIPYLLLLITIASIVFRYFYAFDLDRSVVEYHTLSVMGDMALGGLLAYFYSKHHELISWLKKFATRGIATVSLTVIIFEIAYRNVFMEERLFIALEPLVFGLAIMGVLIVLLNHQAPKWAKHRSLVYLGKISYGLYMYHIIAMALILTLALHFALSPWLIIALSLATTILLASLSYTFFEAPLLKLKKHFGSPDQVSL